MIRKLFRASPWVIAAVALIAFGTTYSELQRWRGKFSYIDAWQHASRAKITDDSIVVLGDSITFNAPLPTSVCGHPVVKLGYSGAGTFDFLVLARGAIEGTRPHMIIVALGANDTQSTHLAADFRSLLEQVSGYAVHVAAVSNTANRAVIETQRRVTSAMGIQYREIAVSGLMPDNVHFNADGYRQWLPSIADSACSQIAAAR